MKQGRSVQTKRVETLLVSVLCFMMTGSLMGLFSEPESCLDALAGDPRYRLLFGCLYSLILLFAVRHVFLTPRTYLRALARSLPVWLLVAWVFTTAAWSDAPSLTLRRAVALGLTTVCGLYVAVRFSANHRFELISGVVGSATIASLLAVAFWPSIATHGDLYSGAWRGLFMHKNNLGTCSAISALLAILGTVYSRGGRRPMYAVVACSSVVACIGARSATSLVVLVTCLLLWPIAAAFRRSPNLVWIFALSAIPIAALYLALSDATFSSFFSLLGRDSSLTGRTELWEVVVSTVRTRPILGFGYSAFWLGPEGQSSAVWFEVGWHAPYSHNGYLDVVLETGLVGLILLVVAALRAGFAARDYLRFATPPAAYFSLLLAALILNNATEGVLVRQHSITWLIFVLIAASETQGRASFVDHRIGIYDR